MLIIISLLNYFLMYQTSARVLVKLFTDYSYSTTLVILLVIFCFHGNTIVYDWLWSFLWNRFQFSHIVDNLYQWRYDA